MTWCIKEIFLAVPTLHLRKLSHSQSQSSLDRDERKKMRTLKNDIEKLLQTTAETTSEGEVQGTEVLGTSFAETLEDRYKMLMEQNQNLQKEFKKMKLMLKEKESIIEKLNKQIAVHTSNIKEEQEKRENLESSLKSFLSRTQINSLLKQKRVVWSSEDIAKAFTLRYLSKRTYIYLRNTLHYPLPHLSTLKR